MVLGRFEREVMKKISFLKIRAIYAAGLVIEF